MRISEAARRLGMSPRMLRYREDLRLLPVLRGRPAGAAPAHRQFTDDDLDAVRFVISVERRFNVSPSELAFALRAVTEPTVRAVVLDAGRRIGRVPADTPGRALDFEKERALRALRGTEPPRHGPRPGP